MNAFTRTRTRTLALFLLLAPASASATGEESYVISPDAGAGTVVFESKAPMESFEGKTSAVAGSVTLDEANVRELNLHVQVEMATLDTGIGMRNRHMCENHLHTDDFPFATFTAGAITEGAGADLGDGGSHEFRVDGTMTLHGVTREVSVPLRLTRADTEDGRRLRIQSEFRVSLPDYDIPRPKFLVMKLNEIQTVRVDLWAAPGTPAP